MLERKGKIRFEELVDDLHSMLNITTAFYAILNALRNRMCIIEQKSIYDVIYIIKADALRISDSQADAIDKAADEINQEEIMEKEEEDLFVPEDEE